MLNKLMSFLSLFLDIFVNPQRLFQAARVGRMRRCFLHNTQNFNSAKSAKSTKYAIKIGSCEEYIFAYVKTT
jgi:hypothetical protein